MHYNQSCAAKGNYGGRRQHQSYRSMQRAAVNIYKTENSFEMLVFAPGRIREHFNLDVRDKELTVSYSPPENFPKVEWIKRSIAAEDSKEFSTFDESIDAGNISAKYADGVLQVSLPVIPGHESVKHEVKIS